MKKGAELCLHVSHDSAFRLLGVVFAVFLGLGLAVPPLAAQGSPLPSLEPEPLALEFSLRGRNRAYTWQELAAIALWASGARGNTAMEQIAAGARDLTASPGPPADPKERGEYILRFIHERYLRVYSTNQTRLDEIFNTGRYNCVSSAVLYVILASAAGMDVHGVMTKDHAFVTVRAGTELIDVETTNPYGFDPGSRRDFHDAFGRTTGFAYVPARNYRNRIAISQLELVSLIFTNRISELESRGRFGEAVPLAANRAALLANRPDPVLSPLFTDPRRDVVDRVYNYGSFLLNAGNEYDALTWITAAMSRYPGEPRWPEFLYACLNNLFVKILRLHRYEEAHNALSRYRVGLNQEQVNKLEGLILDAELMWRIAQIRGPEDVEAALRIIDASGQALAPARAMEMRTFIIVKEGERRADTGGALAAIACIEWGIARYGRNAQLDEVLRIYRANRVVELHNHFVELFNRRDYEAARRIIQGGLEEFPGNRQLRSDMNMVERALR